MQQLWEITFDFDSSHWDNSESISSTFCGQVGNHWHFHKILSPDLVLQPLLGKLFFISSGLKAERLLGSFLIIISSLLSTASRERKCSQREPEQTPLS